MRHRGPAPRARGRMDTWNGFFPLRRAPRGKLVRRALALDGSRFVMDTRLNRIVKGTWRTKRGRDEITGCWVTCRRDGVWIDRRGPGLAAAHSTRRNGERLSSAALAQRGGGGDSWRAVCLAVQAFWR